MRDEEYFTIDRAYLAEQFREAMRVYFAPTRHWWFWAAVIAAAVFLSGCATRPLIVSCITKEQLAELKAQEPEKIREKLTGRADEDVRLIAGSNLRLRSWGGTLMGVLEVCAG